MKMFTVALPALVAAAVVAALALDGPAGPSEGMLIAAEEPSIASAPLPSWHPPVSQEPLALPPGHPPVGALAPGLPEGHPQCPRAAGGPGADAAGDESAPQLLSI
jgi:hypothetical protein